VSVRFYRVDRSRSSASGGLGLGLAIVKSIAQFHGGSVQINSQPGRGTIVTLVLPDSLVQDSIAGPSPAFTRAV
jgi:signal transduction histidine kinase